MKRILDAVLNYFSQQGWPIQQHETEPIVKFHYKGENGQWDCYARVSTDFEQLIFFSVFPAEIPEQKLLALAEFITRANFGLNIGNFEMDFSDGELRYKTSIDVTDEPIGFGQIDPLIQASFVAMDDYLPGIEMVISQDITAKEAFEKNKQLIQEDDDSYDVIM